MTQTDEANAKVAEDRRRRYHRAALIDTHLTNAQAMVRAYATDLQLPQDLVTRFMDTAVAIRQELLYPLRASVVVRGDAASIISPKDHNDR